METSTSRKLTNRSCPVPPMLASWASPKGLSLTWCRLGAARMSEANGGNCYRCLSYAIPGRVVFRAYRLLFLYVVIRTMMKVFIRGIDLGLVATRDAADLLSKS